MNPTLITRKSLADEVAAQLQERILKGTYKLNQKLPVEAELMKTYGVGRSTIREAVKILVNSGFLRVQQGIGTFVEDTSGMNEPLGQRLKREKAGNIDDVRQPLEMKIAEKAAMNRTGNDISKLEHFLIKRSKAANENSIEDAIDAHINFYVVLAEASKNPMLSGLYKLFAAQLKNDLMNGQEDTSFFRNTHDNHHKLFDSVLREDPKMAWYWMGKITGQITQVTR
ncbi:MAG TPA: GntR family transcriptional regulator [Mucilaginibacter sp.]